MNALSTRYWTLIACNMAFVCLLMCVRAAADAVRAGPDRVLFWKRKTYHNHETYHTYTHTSRTRPPDLTSQFLYLNWSKYPTQYYVSVTECSRFINNKISMSTQSFLKFANVPYWNLGPKEPCPRYIWITYKTYFCLAKVSKF